MNHSVNCQIECWSLRLSSALIGKVSSAATGSEFSPFVLSPQNFPKVGLMSLSFNHRWSAVLPVGDLLFQKQERAEKKSSI